MKTKTQSDKQTLSLYQMLLKFVGNVTNLQKRYELKFCVDLMFKEDEEQQTTSHHKSFDQ